MLRDPKLSRCATLVECVCVNVSRGFEFFFFNVTSLTFAVARKVFLLSNSVLRYSTTTLFFFYLLSTILSSSPVSRHIFSVLFLSRFPSFHRVSVATIFASADRRKNGRGKVTLFQVRRYNIGR